MAKITCILATNICRQFFFVIATAVSTHYLTENFQPICYSQRVNAMSQYNDSGSLRCSDGCSGEILLAHCTRKKMPQRNMTKDYYQIGV